MSDATLVVELTPEQQEAARKQGEQDLANWYQKSQQLAQLKEEEANLRLKVVKYYFPNGLKEGTQKADLPEGWKLSVVGSINRKIDVEAQPAISAELKEKYDVDLGDFIKYKPELDLPSYRELVTVVNHFKDIPDTAPQETRDEKAKREGILSLVHQAMIVSDGSPQVQLVAPKKAKVKTVA